jgi:hypothetical protein
MIVVCVEPGVRAMRLDPPRGRDPQLGHPTNLPSDDFQDEVRIMSSAQPLSVLVADPDVETRGALSAFLCE